MARTRGGFDRSPPKPRNLAHHVHTQLSFCLTAVQRALGGASPKKVAEERHNNQSEKETTRKTQGIEQKCQVNTHGSEVGAVAALGELRRNTGRAAAS